MTPAVLCATLLSLSDPGGAATQAVRIPGTWQGMVTAEGQTTHVLLEVRQSGAGLTGEALMWFALSRQQCEDVAGGATLPANIHPRAFAIRQHFDVSLDGGVISFRGTRVERLHHRGPYHRDIFSGPLEAPGVVAGVARDERRVGGWFHFWKQQDVTDPAAPALEPGQVHELTTSDGSNHHYRCYIPRSCEPSSPPAVMINFSPAGNAQPLSITMADRLGWVAVGLTESRNGPMAPNLENLNSVLYDLRRRFSGDLGRLYFSGFSGGARMATWAAVNHPDQCAGVLCIGAGYYDGPPPADLPVFFLVGQTDFNYDEVINLHRAARRAGRVTELRVHPGGHTWGVAADHEAALQWLSDQHRGPRVKP